MSAFTDLQDWYRPHPVNPYYETTKVVCWEIGTKGSDMWIEVPVNYRFDVSVPRCLWWLLSPHDVRFHKGACLHDYALHELGWERVSAAAAFSEALRATGVPRLLRLVMVFSVIAWKWR